MIIRNIMNYLNEIPGVNISISKNPYVDFVFLYYDNNNDVYLTRHKKVYDMLKENNQKVLLITNSLDVYDYYKENVKDLVYLPIFDIFKIPQYVDNVLPIYYDSDEIWIKQKGVLLDLIDLDKTDIFIQYANYLKELDNPIICSQKLDTFKDTVKETNTYYLTLKQKIIDFYENYIINNFAVNEHDFRWQWVMTRRNFILPPTFWDNSKFNVDEMSCFFNFPINGALILNPQWIIPKNLADKSKDIENFKNIGLIKLNYETNNLYVYDVKFIDFDFKTVKENYLNGIGGL